jgi:hypothetical protein
MLTATQNPTFEDFFEFRKLWTNENDVLFSALLENRLENVSCFWEQPSNPTLLVALGGSTTTTT